MITNTLVFGCSACETEHFFNNFHPITFTPYTCFYNMSDRLYNFFGHTDYHYEDTDNEVHALYDHLSHTKGLQTEVFCHPSKLDFLSDIVKAILSIHNLNHKVVFATFSPLGQYPSYIHLNQTASAQGRAIVNALNDPVVLIEKSTRSLLCSGKTVAAVMSSSTTLNVPSWKLDRFYLYSENITRQIWVRKHSEKVDVFGNFIQFHGMTIVCHVDNRNKELDAVLREASQKFGHAYSILPLESMHMTLFNLFAQSKNTDLKSYLKKVQKYKTWAKQYSPKLEGLTLRVVGFYNKGNTIGISVIPEEDKKVKAERARIRASTDIEDKVLDKPHPFHITLGYRYNDKTVPNVSEIKSLAATQLRVKAPQVCEFNDMTKFSPVK